MPEPLITIGITAYREGRWLRECWESVAAQTDPRWEAILVVDGGADRRTIQIAERLRHPRLRKVFCHRNRGPYAARAQAIEAARTGWYAHLDADDRLPPHAVELILQAIEANPDAQFVFGHCLYFGQGPRQLNRVRVFDVEGLVYSPVVNGTSPIRIDLFRQVGGFAPELLRGGADWDFWIGVAELGIKGVGIDATLYERRRHRDGVGGGWRLRRANVAEALIARHPRYFADEGRRRRCLGLSYEQMARDYRALWRRAEAASCALKANRYGIRTPVMAAILEEAEMSRLRYGLRRIASVLASALS